MFSNVNIHNLSRTLQKLQEQYGESAIVTMKGNQLSAEKVISGLSVSNKVTEEQKLAAKSLLDKVTGGFINTAEACAIGTIAGMALEDAEVTDELTKEKLFIIKKGDLSPEPMSVGKAYLLINSQLKIQHIGAKGVTQPKAALLPEKDKVNAKEKAKGIIAVATSQHEDESKGAAASGVVPSQAFRPIPLPRRTPPRRTPVKVVPDPATGAIPKVPLMPPSMVNIGASSSVNIAPASSGLSPDLEPKINTIVTPLPTAAELDMIDVNSDAFIRQVAGYKIFIQDLIENLELENKISLKQDALIPKHESREPKVRGIVKTAVGKQLNANLITVNGINLAVACQYPTFEKMLNYVEMVHDLRTPTLVVLSSTNEIKVSQALPNEADKLPAYFYENSPFIDVKKQEPVNEKIDKYSFFFTRKRTTFTEILHFTNWEDQTVTSTADIVGLVEAIDLSFQENKRYYRKGTSIHKADKVLPLIHCRAGVGRTGTVLALMAMAYLPLDISLAEIVRDIRISRCSGMVQQEQHRMLVQAALAQGRELVPESMK